jgi:hypothetical protein
MKGWVLNCSFHFFRRDDVPQSLRVAEISFFRLKFATLTNIAGTFRHETTHYSGIYFIWRLTKVASIQIRTNRRGWSKDLHLGGAGKCHDISGAIEEHEKAACWRRVCPFGRVPRILGSSDNGRYQTQKHGLARDRWLITCLLMVGWVTAVWMDGVRPGDRHKRKAEWETLGKSECVLHIAVDLRTRVKVQLNSMHRLAPNPRKTKR